MDFCLEKAHERLWNVFTNYTLQGDPLQPNLMRAYEFTKFCQDAGVMEIDSCLTIAELNVVVSQETCKIPGPKKHKRLSFSAFLNAVMAVAIKIYRNEIITPEEAFERFLINQVPRAKFREVVSLKNVEANAEVKSLVQRFEAPLLDIFQYYSSLAERSDAGSKPKAGSKQGRPKQGRPEPLSFLPGTNKMKDEMSYEDFLNCCKDAGLANSSLLSTQALGNVFLSSVSEEAYHDHVPKLRFKEFIQSLLRCSVLIGKFAWNGASHADKFKHILLVMWKSLHERNKFNKTIECHSPKNAYHGDLMKGSMTLNKRFTELWANDGHRDYLAKPVPQIANAFDLLQQMRK